MMMNRTVETNAKLDWETCSVSNGVIVLVELINGTRTLAKQYFGEWDDVLRNLYVGHDNVKCWRYTRPSDFCAIRSALSTLD